MVYRGITINKDSNYIITQGLSQVMGKEFKISTQRWTSEDYLRVIKYLIDYVLDYQPIIKGEQTISYHSWLLKFKQVTNLYYEIWEANSEGNGFTKGVDYSIKVIKEQENLCKQYGVSPIFPTFNQNIVISKGVYEGLGVDAVRYPSPEYMTGWWITTELYDDNIDSLMNVHYFHVAFKRPDLIKYLALPYGFRFYITEQEKEIWFDKEVLEE